LAGRSDSIPAFGKLSGPGSAGAYKNYYKAEKDAKANPAAYSNASNYVSKGIGTLGLSKDWKNPVMELIARESSYNPNAKNPKSSAKGLFQFLDGTRKDYGWKGVDWSNPEHQTLAGLKYIKAVYGTPEKALQHWDEKGWY
jgi:hypothetical protein